MRLASVQNGGDKVAAVVRARGALSVAELRGPQGWPIDGHGGRVLRVLRSQRLSVAGSGLPERIDPG